MRFLVCVIVPLFFVVLAGCFDLNTVTKDTIDDVADCYEQTIVVDDHYAIVLNKDCMDSAILLTTPEPTPTETENISPEYPCPTEDLGDWTLLTTLNRNNFNLGQFRVPKEEIDPITNAYLDNQDFLFIIYQPAVRVDPRFNRGIDRAGGTNQARYHLEAPGLLAQDTLIPHWQSFHFVDPDAKWFKHYDQHRDLSQSGFTIEFDTTPMLEPETYINPREYLYGPRFGTSLDGWIVDGPGAPDINEDVQLKIYTR